MSIGGSFATHNRTLLAVLTRRWLGIADCGRMSDSQARGDDKHLGVTTDQLARRSSTIRRSTRAPDSIRRSPRVRWSWRRLSVGEPGLKIRNPDSATSIGMWEWPNTTRAAAGKRRRSRATRPAARTAVVDHPHCEPVQVQCERFRCSPGRHVRPVVVPQHDPDRGEPRQLLQHVGGADVAGVEDQFRPLQVPGDVGRAALPEARAVGVGQDHDAHHVILSAGAEASPSRWC